MATLMELVSLNTTEVRILMRIGRGYTYPVKQDKFYEAYLIALDLVRFDGERLQLTDEGKEAFELFEKTE